MSVVLIYNTLAGLIADVLLHLLKPGGERLAALRVFACAVPAVFYALNFSALILVEGIWWSTHLWTGRLRWQASRVGCSAIWWCR